MQIIHPQSYWKFLIFYVALMAAGAILATHQSAAQCVPSDLFCMSSLD